MDEIKIDRLTLKLSGLDEEEGRALARRVAERLAEADLSGVHYPEEARLSVRVAAGAAEPVHDITDRIVTELLRQLARSA